MNISDVQLIELPKIVDYRGNLSFIESGNHIPFDIKRVYYLYDVPGGAERGGHAHINLTELLIAISGSFDVIVNDGKNEKRFHLNRPYHGLFLPNMLWRTLDNFSSGSVCMVLASDYFSEEDYIRDFETYVHFVNSK
jgi:dTDP-4-dehydrorhamnose 3,5-epimerase-like enzyme